MLRFEFPVPTPSSEFPVPSSQFRLHFRAPEFPVPPFSYPSPISLPTPHLLLKTASSQSTPWMCSTARSSLASVSAIGPGVRPVGVEKRAAFRDRTHGFDGSEFRRSAGPTVDYRSVRRRAHGQPHGTHVYRRSQREWLYRALHKAGFANQSECAGQPTDDALRCAIDAHT